MDIPGYRKVLEDYFAAFRDGDFSAIRFAEDIEFLSPLSGTTFKGRDEISNFLHGVTTRVEKVEVLSTTIEPPTASGVWQMTTTKGRLYTLNNFFRIADGEITFIWPMFDPKAVMEDPTGLIQWLTGEGY